MTQMSMLSCTSESEKTRWMEVLCVKESDDPNERIYEVWDCPQTKAIYAYVAQQPDELSLQVTDVVNVFRKTADGWYEGERIRDGEKGWFPGNYCVEIESSHVRARNLRQRYRLLALSGDLLQEQNKKDTTSSPSGTDTTQPTNGTAKKNKLHPLRKKASIVSLT